MSKLIYTGLGLIVFVALVLLIGTSPGSTPTALGAKSGTMDIRAIEAASDVTAMPQQELSPEVYQ